VYAKNTVMVVEVWTQEPGRPSARASSILMDTQSAADAHPVRADSFVLYRDREQMVL